MTRAPCFLPAGPLLLGSLGLALAACPPVRPESPDATADGGGQVAFFQSLYYSWYDAWIGTLLLPYEDDFECPSGYGYGFYDDDESNLRVEFIRGSAVDWEGDYGVNGYTEDCEDSYYDYDWSDRRCLYYVTGVDADGDYVTADADSLFSVSHYDDERVSARLTLGNGDQIRASATNCGEMRYNYYVGDGSLGGAGGPDSGVAPRGPVSSPSPWGLRFR